MTKEAFKDFQEVLAKENSALSQRVLYMTAVEDKQIGRELFQCVDLYLDSLRLSARALSMLIEKSKQLDQADYFE